MSLCQKKLFIVIAIILSGCASPATPTQAPPTKTPQPTKVVFLPTLIPVIIPTVVVSNIPLPQSGFLYHGVYPGGITGDEDDITLRDLLSYEQTVGKPAAWVYFSNNWYHSRKFPTRTVAWIRDAGSIPYIRLMLRPDIKYDGEETIYTLQNIIDGYFDDDLRAWCMDAHDFSTNIIVEYGTEVNSDSFVWSGIYNGGKVTDGYGNSSIADGPERFRDAYKHIIRICREEGALNITWVFHLDGRSYPDEDWNRMENYYPGDEWIDWIGVSIYGAHKPTDIYFDIFQVQFTQIYPRIVELAGEKPLIISEFATTRNNPFVDQIAWTNDAFTTLTSDEFPNLIGFSWWNEAWQNDSNPEHDTTMRVQDNPELEELFQEFVGDNPQILGEIAQ